MNNEKIKYSDSYLNKNVSDKINAMNILLDFMNATHWVRSDNAHYPNFIVDIWDDEKDYYFNEYLDSNCSISAFYSNLNKSDKIEFLNYVLKYRFVENII